MNSTFNPVVRTLAVLCLLSSGFLRAQIAPATDILIAAPKADSTPIPQVENPAAIPKAQILGWSLNSEVTPTRRGAVSLDPGNLELIIFFADGHHPSGTEEFRYRLDDYDPDWTITHEHLAHYRRLSPGKYEFKVQSRLAGQPWVSSPAAMSVTQRPFFYQTWYFYLLVFAGLVLLAAELLSQRDRLLKGQMGIILEERNRIASDCHDTLMAGFAAVSWQLEATSKLFDDTEAGTPASQSCELARSMVAHCQAEARRIIWDLRDSEELTNILSLALSRAIDTHRLRDTIETKMDVQGSEIPIAPGAVHHLVCIGQEAVTNAIRHAHASVIHILVRYEDDCLCLSVRDNGQGFHNSGAAVRAGHFGIPVMEERARKLGGSLRLSSSEGNGTEVAVTVSFHTINLPMNQQHHVMPWIGL